MNSIEPPTPGPEERRRLVVGLVRDAAAEPGLSGVAGALQRLCRAVTESLGLRGASVHLMAADEGTGVVASSDVEARMVAELQFMANEGPAIVAFRTRRPVLLPDVGEMAHLWPGFCSLALERGVQGVFALPLQEGAVALGVLELYADRTGPLDAPRLALATTFAREATDLLLDGGTVPQTGELDPGLSAPLADRARIHQAQGMVMVDLRVSLAEALSRMRARAFAAGFSLLEVAEQVIAGTLTAEEWTDDSTPDGSLR